MRDATIREIKPEDSARVAELMTQLGYAATADDVAQRLTYGLDDPLSRVLVAERNTRVIGSLSIHAIPYLERTGRWARVDSLQRALPGRRACLLPAIWLHRCLRQVGAAFKLLDSGTR